MPESKTQEAAKTLVMKNKLLFLFCMMFIMSSLALVCYLFFFRSVDIDITKNVKLNYIGESGSATVEIENNNSNMNQRIQEFLDTLRCSANPKENITNGTQLTIMCSYSEEIANKYNITAINEQKEIVVEGLAERYEQSSDIPASFLATLDTRAESFFERNMDAIIEESFPQFYVTSNTQFKEKTRIHRVFLKSVNSQNKDKIVDIYKLSVSGKVNQGVDHEDLVEEVHSIFYAISYDNINSFQKLENDTIFGSELVSEFDDLSSQENVKAALRMKYLLNYGISFIE